MVLTFVDNDLCVNKRSVNFVAETPTNSASAAGFDEVILWSCVESILALDKLRMQHNIPLLRRMSFQVRQALPILKVMSPRDAALSNRGRKIAWRRIWIFTFSAE